MGRPHALLRLAGGRPLLLLLPSPHGFIARHRPTTCAPWRSIVVLGIETSADDTCAAFLRVEGTGADRVAYSICDDRISCANTQLRGIHPYDAVVSHTNHLSLMVYRLMQNPASAAAMPHQKPDLIAVTRGPGMGGCLSVGVTTAKALAVAWSVPIIGVHHMQAHALTPMMEAAMARGSPTNLPPPSSSSPRYPLTFPFLTLLISGKHTMLVHTRSNTSHRILASADTIALGDMLDKCARDILPASMIPTDPAAAVVYPKLLEQFVADDPQVRSYRPAEPEVKVAPVYVSAAHGWTLPPPNRMATKALDFDFTGFGGHVRKIVQQRRQQQPPPISPAVETETKTEAERNNVMDIPERKELAVQTMKLAFEYVLGKVVLALRTEPDLVAAPPSHLVLSGGVASNLFLRAVAEATLRARGFGGIRVLAPALRYCTDNAPMVAFAGAQMYEDQGDRWMTDLRFAPKVKWSIEEILSGADCWVRRPSPSEAKESHKVDAD